MSAVRSCAWAHQIAVLSRRRTPIPVSLQKTTIPTNANTQKTVKRYGNLYPQIVDFENLLTAAQKAEKGKRFRENVLHFNHNREVERVFNVRSRQSISDTTE